MTLGMHFALSAADEKRLLDTDEEERPDLVSNALEESYSEEWTCDIDVSWDAIHRAFNDSELSYDLDEPLQGVVFGGEPLTDGDDYVISYKDADEVKSIAAALREVTEADFRTAYFAIDPEAYEDDLTEDDFASCWRDLQELQAFYSRAATADRSVIFTVSQ